MSQYPPIGKPHSDEERIEGFIDCIARLLARRWLRDRREQPVHPPQESEQPGAKKK